MSKKIKTLSPEVETKLSKLALLYAKYTAFPRRPEETGVLFLRLRQWHLNNPGKEIAEKQIMNICKCIRIEELRRETKMDRKTKKPKRDEVSLEQITLIEGEERKTDFPKALIEDNTAAERDHNDFVRLLKKLPTRLKKVLELRSEGYSLGEIGESLGGLTVERARQLVTEAVEKMREMARK